MEWPWNRKKMADIWTWPHIFWLNIFGWWGEEAKTEFSRKWLIRVRSLSMVYFVCLITSMAIQVCLKFAEGDIMQNLFTIFASGPGNVGLFKFFDFIIHRKLLKSVMDRLSAMIHEINNPELQSMARKSFKRTWIVFILSLVVLNSIVLHWALRPLIVAAFYNEKTTLVDSWPVLLDSWAQFTISYFGQIPGVIMLGHSFYIYDNVFFCTSEVILCHLSILKHRLNNLVLSDDKSSTKELISCIKYYSNILSVCNDFKDATSRVIMWQSVHTVIMLCTGIFILTYLGKDINPNAAMNLGEVSFSLTACLYLYCWYSNEITYQCSDVSNAIYMTDWVNAKFADKKAMLITMSRAIQPVIFGGLLEISLNTFINVLKTTFSFYNFLIAVRLSSTDNNQ